MYEYIKRLGQQHFAEDNASVTLCGKPMLGNNYAGKLEYIVGEVTPCAECQEVIKQGGEMTDMKKETRRQELNSKLVEREVLICQTGLIEEILKTSCQHVTELPSYDDIENQYEYKCPECGHGEIDQDAFDNGEVEDDHPQYTCPYCKKDLEELPHISEPQEIYEWWLVTQWFYEKLKAQGEPVLCHDDFNHWWGRTTTGQSIMLDHVIDDIRKASDIFAK